MATTGKKGGSKMIFIIGGLIVIAGGIGAYFLLRKPKEEKSSGDSDTDSDTAKDEVSSLGSVSTTKTYTAPSDLNDSTKIKAFQDWLDANKPCWLLDSSDNKYKNLSKNAGDCNRNIGGKGYGTYGKNTDIAWKSFGSEYLKSSKKSPFEVVTSIFKPKLDSDIELIIKNATGTKSEKSYLVKANVNFVKTWSKAIGGGKKAFIWENQVYRTDTGDKVLEYNPIGVKHYAKLSGEIAKLSASNSSNAEYVTKGTDLGKISGLNYNNGLWFYAPDESSIYKWYRADYLSRQKPSSSFDGANNQIEFSSFDNNLDLNL